MWINSIYVYLPTWANIEEFSLLTIQQDEIKMKLIAEESTMRMYKNLKDEKLGLFTDTICFVANINNDIIINYIFSDNDVLSRTMLQLFPQYKESEISEQFNEYKNENCIGILTTTSLLVINGHHQPSVNDMTTIEIHTRQDDV